MYTKHSRFFVVVTITMEPKCYSRQPHSRHAALSTNLDGKQNIFATVKVNCKYKIIFYYFMQALHCHVFW